MVKGRNRCKSIKTNFSIKVNKINLGIREYEFYFLHSFFCSTKDINVEASSFYGVHFPSIVNKDNIYGTQFHPEKSHEGGLKLLLNFSNI